MEKIVFFGGTFDPPHKEHIALAKAAQKKYSPCKIIIMPTAVPPHKDAFFPATAYDRLEMCKIAFAGVENAEVSDMEIKSGGKSYSYITIGELKKKYGCADLIFVMGTDMLRTFGEWKNPEKILENCRLSLCGRSGDEETEKAVLNFKKQFGADVDVIGYVGKDVSSSEYKISKMLGLESDAVSEEVGKYIDEKGLYPPDEYFKYARERLKLIRLIHTKGVILAALKIAKKLGVDVHKTITAAVLHDSAKYLDYKEFKDFKLPFGVPTSVVHQFLGGYIAEKVLKITDSEIIEAITYHTSGKAGMCLLSKIIYVADMIEEGREFSGVDKLREEVERDFDEGFKKCLIFTVEHLKASGKEIYFETLNALKYYTLGEN